VVDNVVNLWSILLSRGFSHDSSNGLFYVRLWGHEENRVETRNVKTLVRLTERREDDSLFTRLREVLFLHATHVESGLLICKFKKQMLTVKSSVAEDKELSIRLKNFPYCRHNHRVSNLIFTELRNHGGQIEFSESRGRRGLVKHSAVKLKRDDIHLFLVLPFDREEYRTHEPIQNFCETILSVWGRRETKDVLGANFEEGLRKNPGANVVRLIHENRTDALKLIHLVLLRGE
jgi:hypothetical protein